MFDMDNYRKEIQEKVREYNSEYKGLEYEGSIFEEHANHVTEKINARIDTEIAMLTSQLDMMKEQQREDRETSRKADKLSFASIVVAIISLAFAMLTYFFG